MKKVLKILLIIFLVICVIIACLAVWQRKNIKLIYTAVTEGPKEITRLQEENNKTLVDEVGNYLNGELRDFTPEEREKVESGEVQITDVYNDIIKEHIEKRNQEVINNISSEETNEDATQQKVPVKTELSEEEIKNKTDEIVSNAISELYDLQSSYTAKSEALIAQAKSEFDSIRKNGVKWNQAKTNIISKYTPKVRAIQSSCDSDVNAIVTRLEGDLKEIGANLGIINTIRQTYEKEKELKLAYYAGAYLD